MKEAADEGCAESVLAQAADEFTERLNRDERPDIEEYARRYPQLEAVIRQVFPALLAMHTRQAGLPTSDAAPGAAVGCLGEYRLIREIGRGGMGIVYEAEQLSLRRRVALKVLPFAAVLDRRQLRRFRNEAQAAAHLHHTNIVPVFSVGCEQGVHYYAMQFIEGQALSTVLDELRRSRPTSLGAPRTEAYHRSVVELALQAAEGLQHAHERGVIHRDIKPSNLLLDVGGKLWIADFGLATMQTDASLTMPGDLLGTIRYMSPEQTLARRVRLDHRTDIYSLGITLYELLSLAPAFAGNDRQELLRQIAAEDLRPLRRVDSSIPRELEVIVAKATAKSSAERYQTAQELGEDLRRFLEDRPILARPPTLMDRAAKWSRRHRRLMATAAALVVVAVLGLSASMLLIARARAEAVRQRDAARANFQLARDAVDRMLTRVAADLADVPHTESAQRALLTDAMQFYEHFLQGQGADPQVRLEAARARSRVGRINELLGQYGPAEHGYRQAIVLFASLAFEFPDAPENAQELAGNYHSLGELLWQLGRSPEAESAQRQAVILQEKLVARWPDRAQYRAELATSLTGLGVILRDTERLDEANRVLQQALGLYEKLTQEAPTSRAYLSAAARVQNERGLLFKDNHTEAIAAFQQAVALQEKVVAEPGASPADRAALAGYLSRLAPTIGGGVARPADEAWPRALAVRKQLSGDLAKMAEDFPGVPEHRERRGENEAGLGLLLFKTGRLAEAELAYRRAAELREQLIREFPSAPANRRELGRLYYWIGTTLQWRVMPTEAEAAFHRAMQEQEKLVAEFPDDARYQRELDASRRQAENVRDMRDVMDIISLGKRSPEGVAEAVEQVRCVNLETAQHKPFARLVYSSYLMLGGDPKRAAAGLQRGAEQDPAQRNDEAFMKSLGWALLAAGRPEEAREAFHAALGSHRIWSPEPPLNANPDHWMAAYFLDLVSQEQFTGRWAGVVLGGMRYACFPWFYVGQRKELEARLDEAKAAYTRCVELGREPGSHHAAHWAAYRLKQLTAHSR